MLFRVPVDNIFFVMQPKLTQTASKSGKVVGTLSPGTYGYVTVIKLSDCVIGGWVNVAICFLSIHSS